MSSAEKDTIYEIKGSNTQSTALTHKIHHMEENVLKLDEMLYSADFEIQCLERKVARASGERSNLESKELKEKMMDLEKEHEDRKSEETLVISQVYTFFSLLCLFFQWDFANSHKSFSV